MKRRKFVPITMTVFAVALALLLTLSIGSASIQITPHTHLVVRRGALELAFSDYTVRAVDRDDWSISVPSGVPGIGICLPPRSFWYPTMQSRKQTFQYGPVARNLLATMGITVIAVPLVVPTVLATLLAVWLWIPQLCRPRAMRCAACDYDLTGNTSGRCPECGKRTARGPLAILMRFRKRPRIAA